MKRRYEAVFIITPVLSEVQMKEAVDKFRSFINENGGEVLHEENWGLKKLAYPIQKKSTGFYELFEFEADTEMIGKLETQFRHDERIIRFLTMKLDKYALEYAEKRRNKKVTVTEKKED